jgi:hypothetical protein
MDLNQLQQQLADLANSGDPVFAQAANNIQQMVEAAKAGQLAPADLKEILLDQQRQLSIVSEMSQLQFKEQLNTILTGLITIASLAV